MLFAVLFELVRQQEELDNLKVLNNQLYRNIPLYPLSNLFYTRASPIRFIVISMKRSWDRLARFRKRMEKYNLEFETIVGLDSEKFTLDQLEKMVPLAPHIRQFCLTNDKKRPRGNVACTISHMNAWSAVTGMTVIMEDDAYLCEDFVQRLQEVIARVESLDPLWNVIALGFMCNYKDYPHCVCNDDSPIYDGGVARLKFMSGGYGYLIRDQQTAQHILTANTPMVHFNDILLGHMSRKNELSVWGCIPNLVLHPGTARVSSFDSTNIAEFRYYSTFTN